MTHDTTTPPAVAMPRRGFLTKFLAAVIGGFVGLVPVFAGGLFFFSPLLRKKRASDAAGANEGYIKVASAEAVPSRGQAPLRVQVISDRTDAWTKFPEGPIGAVFLQKNEKDEVVCFNVTCPHLGCSVDYRSGEGAGFYHCPCHNSSFSIDGERKNEIPPRGMDTLEVDVNKLKEGEVWIKFQEFRTGAHDKIAKS